MGMAFNVLAYIALAMKPKRELTAVAGVPAGLRKIATTREPAPCPACGATNHPSAAKCLECGAALRPQTRSEVEKAS
jgi:ribosomal protein L40E